MVVPVVAALALVLVLAVVPATRATSSVPGTGSWAGPPGAWTTVFADEFTGPGLDSRSWRTTREAGEDGSVPFNPVIEDAWFAPHGVTVADGRLVLTTRSEPRTLDGRRYAYSSGMVQSLPAVALQPVRYVEARISVPSCSGCWPAFWLHPLDRWPPEIDIAEFMEAGSESRPSFNYIDPAERRTGPQQYGDPATDYRDGFHTYGLLWDGERAVPYLDGVPQEEIAATRDMTSMPLGMILNLSVRGGYSPPPGARMLVDWVRVWAPRTGS